MIKDKREIKLRDGLSLSTYIVENGSPCWIVITHGLGEHAERHDYYVKLFGQYFNICLYDLRGHGDSEGARAGIKDFKDYRGDLDEVLDYLETTFSMKKFILFGHSLGGLITASYMQNSVKVERYPQKVFLSAPATGGAGALGSVFAMTPMKIMSALSSLRASVSLKGMLDINKLSHDPRVPEAYIADERCILAIPTKTFFIILHEARNVFSRPLRVTCELYCALGSGDEIVAPEATINYFKTIEKNAKLKVIENGYHELHNEVDKYQTPYFKFLKEAIYPKNS